MALHPESKEAIVRTEYKVAQEETRGILTGDGITAEFAAGLAEGIRVDVLPGDGEGNAVARKCILGPLADNGGVSHAVDALLCCYSVSGLLP